MFSVGKKPSVSPEEQQQEFELNLAAIIIDGKLAKSSNKIYYDIAEKFQMTKQAVYLAVKRYVLSRHPNAAAIDCEQAIDDKESDNDADYVPSCKFKAAKDAIRFTIDIKGCQIFSQQDQETNDQWKNELIQILWEFSRLPCAWRFERYREVCNEVNVHANCTECKGTLFVFTENKKNKLSVVMKSGQPDAVHKEKIQLSKKYLDEIVNMLKADSNCVVQAKLADHLMTSNDIQPAHLPNLHALDQVRYLENKKKCLHEDPAISLKLMKNTPLFNNCIGDIGLDPFFCSYGTELQREFQRREIDHRRCVISADSTGMCECIYEIRTV